jgi:carboxypeptidase family protein/TonB-dependent receptor-like protein
MVPLPPKPILSPVVLVAFAYVLFTQTPALAQAQGGAIGGVVRAASGAPVAVVHIRLRLSDGAVRAVTTGPTGRYRFSDLQAGSYEITVSAPGFVTQEWTGLRVALGTDRVLNILMRPGDPSHVVQAAVPAAPQRVGAGDGNVSASTVENTPLNGRDWTQLASLQAGVTGVQAGNANGTGNADRGFGAAVSVSGARPDQNSYRLDGISINDYSNGAPGSVLGDNLGVDAVEQVSVLGNNYPAEYGRTSGGVINAVTRSGANSFHGDLYEFLRNSVLDARNYFDGRIPAFKRNQFGGSGGGTLQKDRTFIFGDYEGLRQSLGVTTVDTVPSAAARKGKLSTGTVAVDPAVARFLAAFYPLPNGPLQGAGDTGIFNFAGQQVTNEDYFTIRVDRKFSQADSVSGTYMRDSSKTVQPDNFDELLSNVVSGRQVVAVHEQHIFGPTMLNAARLGFTRAVGIVGGVSQVLNPNMFDPAFGFEPGGFAGGVEAVPGVTDFGGAPTAQGPLPSSRFVFWNSFQDGDDLSLTRGVHSLKFGGVVERMQDNELSFGSTNGVFRFDSLSNFLTNHPLVFQGMRTRVVPDVGLRETLVGAYAQDDIRLQRNFTLNTGLRYEMVTVPTEAHNRISNLRNLTDAQPRVGAPFFSNATLRNFEPRLGFAWNPRTGKTLVRGGFGIFDVLPLPYEFNLSFQRAVPFVQSIYASDLAPGSFPTGAFQQFGFDSTSALATYVQHDPKRNYVMQWNLGVARQLSSTLSVTLAYVGSRGVHQPYRMDNIDMVLPTLTPAGYVFPAAATSQKLNPNFGRIDATLWQANSVYHALQADVSKRVSHGFEFHGAYTWGKSIDTLSATEADDAFPNGLFNQLFFDQRTSRGLSDFNVAQALVLSMTWELPGARFNSRLAKWALSGWQLGGLYKANTGQPFTPILGGDPLGMKLDETSEPPDLLTGPACRTLTNPGDPTHYIKAQCLGFPVPRNRWGNLGRNSLIGPGLSKLDFSVFKNNRIRLLSEDVNVQFRAEFFNILNHTNFASPTDHLVVIDESGKPVPSAGLITSTQTASRQIQLAMKVIW